MSNPFETLSQIITDAEGIAEDMRSDAGNDDTLTASQSEALKDAAALVDMARALLDEAHGHLCDALGDPDATEPSFAGEAPR